MFKKVFLVLMFASSFLSALTKPNPNIEDFLFPQSQDSQLISQSNIGSFLPNGNPDVYSYQVNSGVAPYSSSISSSPFVIPQSSFSPLSPSSISAPPSTFSLSGSSIPISSSSFSVSSSPFSVSPSPFSLQSSPFSAPESSLSQSPFSLSQSSFSVPQSPFPVAQSPFPVAQSPFSGSTYSFSSPLPSFSAPAISTLFPPSFPPSVSPFDYPPFFQPPRYPGIFNDNSFGLTDTGFFKPNRPFNSVIPGIPNFGGNGRPNIPYY